MDKWELVARAINSKIKTCDSGHGHGLCIMCEDAGKCENEAAIAEALRQCEADTIRRCAGELSDAAANYADSEHSDVRMLWLASKTILALLPEE